MNSDQYALHEAAKARNRSRICALLKDGFDVNLKDLDGRTPLHYAVLSSRPRPDAANAKIKVDDISDPTSLLQLDVASSQTFPLSDTGDETLNEITGPIRQRGNRYGTETSQSISQFKSLNATNFSTKDSNQSSEDENIEAVVPLRVKRRRISKSKTYQSDNMGHTHSLLPESRDCIYALVDNAPNLNANIQDKDGRTPLHLAAQLDSSHCVDILLREIPDLDVNIKDTDGNTFFQIIAFPDWQRHIEKFLTKGADPSDIKRWWESRQDSSTAERAPTYLKLWENAANGFDYGTVNALLDDWTAGLYSVFGPIVLEWEIPALLNLCDSARIAEDEAQWLDPSQQVILVSHEKCLDYRKNSNRVIHATTFAEYLAQNMKAEWCSFLLRLLDLVKLANLSSEDSGFSVCAIRAHNPRQAPPVSVTCYHSSVLINLPAIISFEAINLIKALDWICKAMRIPRAENTLNLSSTTCRLERREVAETGGGLPSLFGNRTYYLRPRVDLKLSPLPHSDHNCWHHLFQACIVAESTILRSRDFGKGLEISFDLMVSLAAVDFCLVIEGGVVFVGYQTVLFPTAIEGEYAQFHSITSDSGQINPYMLDLGERVLTEDPFQFKRMRCFLGWCNTVQINLGTKQLPATVKYSGGRNHGDSMQLDGFSMLAQVGASAPLAAVLGLQTNFKYASHRRQFTPLGNYWKLLQDASREQAIIYDAGQRRSWLVPKLSLLLHMCHAYTLACTGTPDDRVPYVDPHCDAIEVIKALEPLGDTPVCGGKTDKFLFRELLLGLNTNLLKTVASIRRSSGKKLYGFEFMDVVTEPGRGSCMKKLDVLSLAKNWLEIVNVVDAVVVCSDLGEAIIAVEGNGRKSTSCNMLPKNLDYLAATLPCLARLAEREGGGLSAGGQPIRIGENTLWELRGNPFGICQHGNSNETCWKRLDLVQRLVRKRRFEFRVPLRAVQPSPLKQLPASGAVVFGKWDP